MPFLSIQNSSLTSEQFAIGNDECPEFLWIVVEIAMHRMQQLLEFGGFRKEVGGVRGIEGSTWPSRRPPSAFPLIIKTHLLEWSWG